MTEDTRATWGHLDTVTGSMTGSLRALDPHLPGLTVLCHPDPSRIGERALLGLSTPGQFARVSRLEPLFAPIGGDRRRALMDPRLSRRPLELRADEGGGVEIRATTNLRVMVDGEPLRGERRCTADELGRGIVLLLSDRITLLLHLMEVLPPSTPSFGLVGQSIGIHSVRRQIASVCDLDVPCLVRGESGTGKELVASAIHRGSPRRDRPFEAVNMGALPPSLAASTLFGAEKGAFTGADRKREGLFRQAHLGTLFLDEIGETPAEVQVLLFRVLETSRIRPVGAESETAVDVRLVAATDADLEAAIEDGSFKAPLLHRLSGYEIHLPPLRTRIEDLGVLLVHFLRQELETMGESHHLLNPAPRPWLPAPLVARLALFDWPGNVRQLRNTARQLVIANRGEAQLRLPPGLVEKLTPRARVPQPGDAATGSSSPSTSTGGAAGDSGALPVIPSSTASADSESRSKVSIEALLCCSIAAADAEPTGPEVRRRSERSARSLLPEYGGHAIDGGTGTLGEDTTAPSTHISFFVFERPIEAVGFAFELHEIVQGIMDELGRELSSRIAIQLAEIERSDGTPHDQPAVHATALGRSRSLVRLALPTQTLLDRSAFDLARGSAKGEHPLADPSVRWLEHGPYALADGSRVEVAEVGLEGQAPLEPPEPLPKSESGRGAYRSPDEVSEDELIRALRQNAWKLQPAAAALGISRTSLYALVDRSPRIRKGRDLKREEIEKTSERHGGDLDAMAAELEVSRKALSRRMTQLKMKK